MRRPSCHASVLLPIQQKHNSHPPGPRARSLSPLEACGYPSIFTSLISHTPSGLLSWFPPFSHLPRIPPLPRSHIASAPKPHYSSTSPVILTLYIMDSRFLYHPYLVCFIFLQHTCTNTITLATPSLHYCTILTRIQPCTTLPYLSYSFTSLVKLV